MNVSVPLPGIEPADSSDTRWALQTAQTLWGQGERREALQWVRRAAEAAAETGQDDRALALAKAGAELRTHLEIPRTVPPPAVTAADGAVPRPAATPEIAIPRPAATPDIAVPRAPATSDPVIRRSAAPEAPAPRPSASPSVPVPPASARGESELVVTLVSTDGTAPGPDASLVSHRAVRVAVLAESKEPDLRIRVLAPGEVAPKDSTVALLVALATGASPVGKP
jgi:hypothetical protein